MHRSTSAFLVFMIVAAVSSGLAVAQAPNQTPAQAQVQPQPQPLDPRVLSGADIGFRVEGMDRSGNPTGTLVVRVQGKWLPAMSQGRTIPLTLR